MVDGDGSPLASQEAGGSNGKETGPPSKGVPPWPFPTLEPHSLLMSGNASKTYQREAWLT